MNGQPPIYQENRGLGPTVPPAVVTWFKVYSVAMALLYLLVAGLGVFFLVAPEAIDQTATAEDLLAMKMVGWIYLALGVAFTIPFLIGIFMGNAPWCWIYGMVLICLSLTSICCMPAGIPLLIFWLKPETKLFYGRNA